MFGHNDMVCEWEALFDGAMFCIAEEYSKDELKREREMDTLFDEWDTSDDDMFQGEEEEDLFIP